MGEYDTIAMTPGLDKEFIRKILIEKGYIEYSKPKSIAEPMGYHDLEKYPVAYRFFSTQKKRIFSKIHYVGPSNHTLNRYGNIFADTIIIHSVENDFKYATPINIFNNKNISWKKRLTLEEDVTFDDDIPIEKKSFSANIEIEAIADIFNLLEIEEHFLSKISILLENILEELSSLSRRKIVIYGKEKNIRNLILAVSSLFSHQFLEHLSLSTYTNDPKYSPFFINGIISESEISLSNLKKYSNKYVVIELDLIKETPPIKNKYTEFLIDLIRDKNTNDILNLLNEDYQFFNVNKLDKAIDIVAEFHSLLYSIRKTNDLEVILEKFNSLFISTSLSKRKVEVLLDRIFKETVKYNPEVLNQHLRSQLLIEQNSYYELAKQIKRIYDLYKKYFEREDENYSNDFLIHTFSQLEEKKDNKYLADIGWTLILEFEHNNQINNLNKEILINQWCHYASKLVEIESDLNETEKREVFNKIKSLANDPKWIHEHTSIYHWEVRDEILYGKIGIEASLNLIREFQRHLPSTKLNNRVNYITSLLYSFFNKKKAKDVKKYYTNIVKSFVRDTDDADIKDIIKTIAILLRDSQRDDMKDTTYHLRNILVALCNDELFGYNTGRLKDLIDVIVNDSELEQLLVMKNFYDDLVQSDFQHQQREKLLSILEEIGYGNNIA